MKILYVSDLIIFASNIIQIKWLKSKLEKEYEMSDRGELHYCLAVEFERNGEACTITMNQKNYIKGGKLSSVSVERSLESRKFALCWAIFIEGVPMTVEFGDNLNSIC